MSGRVVKILRILFIAYAVITAAHIAYVVYHEPFAFDAWNVAVDSGAEPITFGRFFAFWKAQYLSSNPRIGQPLAYLTYKVVGFGELGGALAFLAIALGAFVVGLGRWPSWRRGRDLALLSIAIGFLWFVAPDLGSLLFCRAYATNYVWAAAIQLWFIALLRLTVKDLAAPASTTKIALTGLLGVVAGMCNEHTGPTLVLFAAALAWWWWRREGRPSKVLVAAAVGSLLGFALIFFAPGQNQRYDGLAHRLTLKDRLLARGISANLDIFDDLLFAAGPLLVVLVLSIIMGTLSRRRERDGEPARDEAWVSSLRVLGLAIGAGVLITVTVFVSPKLGPRFYLHSMVLLLAAFLGVVAACLHTPRSFAPLVVLAVLSSTYAFARTVPLYTRLKHDSDERLAGLTAAAPNSVYTADSWEQIPGTAWFLGDDFRDQKKRELVAKYFALKRVVFRGLNPLAALGVSDVRLRSEYTFDEPLCIDEQAAVEIPAYIGRDVPAIHFAFLDNITEIQEANLGHLRTMDLVVQFRGDKPPMPKDRIYLARWNRGVFEGYRATITRRGRTTNREIVAGPELTKRNWDLYLVSLGDPPRLLGPAAAPDAPSTPAKYTYVPWRSGAYWVMACDAEACWVVSATYHRI